MLGSRPLSVTKVKIQWKTLLYLKCSVVAYCTYAFLKLLARSYRQRLVKLVKIARNSQISCKVFKGK